MSLVNEIIKDLLPEEKSDLSKVRTTAIYAGGFKPPTAGHFAVAKQALMQHPEIDEFIIYIGNKTRDGVDQNQSLLIWDIYKNYLSIKVVLEPTSKPPIQAVYNYAKENPDEEVIWIIGAREGNEEDFKDIAKRTKSLDKYPNLELDVTITASGASGTAARNASKISLEKLKPLLPKVLSDQQYQDVFNILDVNLKENEPPLLKEILDPANFDFKPLIKSLTKSMEEDGLELKPYPKVKFIHDEEANAEDFFGKTAYYDPNNNKIVLYTLGRHPKDIMRSYAHELIHVHQNHEDRLEGISTDNVNEDDYLEKIEREAYEKGNISFRSWTNKTLNEATKKINYTNPNFKDEWEEAIRYSEFKEMGIKSWIKIANKGYVTNYSKIKDKLGNVDLKFDSLEEPKKQRFQDALNKGNIEMSIAVKFSDDDYDLVAGNTRISGLVKNKIDPKIWVVDLSNNLNEAVVGDKIECDNCDWSWDIVSGGDDLFVCHKCGHDNELINEKKTKDPFGLNAFAHELAQLNEEEGEYYIYLDMDGVVADFDKRFNDLSGMLPQAYVDKNGLNAFWDLIDEKHKVAFWRGIELMPGAEKLVRYIEQHPFEMLTAPSIKKQSVIGKSLWVKDKVGTLYSTKPKVTYRSAKQKHTVKPNLTKFDILIDDKGSSIDNWNAAGGTGIFYKNADQVINDLKKLGL